MEIPGEFNNKLNLIYTYSVTFEVSIESVIRNSPKVQTQKKTDNLQRAVTGLKQCKLHKDDLVKHFSPKLWCFHCCSCNWQLHCCSCKWHLEYVETFCLHPPAIVTIVQDSVGQISSHFICNCSFCCLIENQISWY